MKTMTLEKFEKYMLEIKKYLDSVDRASKAVQVLASDSFAIVDFAGPLLSAYIRLLSENVGDKSEWIDWFVFENDFGKGGMVAGKEGDMQLVDTVEKLYNLIEL